MADSKKVLEIIRAIGLKMEAEKEYLTELDQPIGDSDHGINMARGFAAVEGKLPDLEGKDIGTILKTVGMTLVSTVGGASGPLYGSAYMKAGMALAGKEEMDMDDFLSMSVREALEAGVRAAWAGAEHTKDLVATKGRASYVGERGLGHQDPGATSYSYMLEVIAGLV